MIIRLRHEDATDRFDIDPSQTLATLLDLFNQKHSLPQNSVKLYSNIEMTNVIDGQRLNVPLIQLGVRDGTMLFVDKKGEKTSELEKMPFKAPFCNHSEKVRCPNCIDYWKKIHAENSSENYEKFEKIPENFKLNSIEKLKYLEDIAPVFDRKVLENSDIQNVFLDENLLKNLSNLAKNFSQNLRISLYGKVESDGIYIHTYFYEQSEKNLEKFEKIAKIFDIKKVGVLYLNQEEFTSLQVCAAAYDHLKYGKKFIFANFFFEEKNSVFESYFCSDFLVKMAAEDSINYFDDEKIFFAREIFVEKKLQNYMEKNVFMIPIPVSTFSSFLCSDFPLFYLEKNVDIGTVSSFILMKEDHKNYEKWNDLNLLFVVGKFVGWDVAAEIATMVKQRDPKRDDSGFVCLVNVSAT